MIYNYRKQKLSKSELSEDDTIFFLHVQITQMRETFFLKLLQLDHFHVNKTHLLVWGLCLLVLTNN